MSEIAGKQTQTSKDTIDPNNFLLRSIGIAPADEGEGEVDAGGDDHEGHADGDDRDEGGRQGHVAEVVEGAEGRHDEDPEDDDDGQWVAASQVC